MIDRSYRGRRRVFTASIAGRMSWLALILGLLLVPVPRAEAACDGAPEKSGAITVSSGGLTRRFVVRLPFGYDGRTPAPVIVVFHPFGMNAQYMQTRAPVARWWPEAIGVYPEGAPRSVTNPAPGWQSRVGEMGNRDLDLFDAIMGWLRENACVDGRRVFVLGYSNGGQLASLLACERSAAVAGVAIAAGRLDCMPAAAEAVVISHGTRDSTIAYGQAVAAAESWAARNSCRAPPRSGAAGCFAAEGCGAASPLMLCTHGGGHEYDSSFTRTAVEFFKAAPAAP